MDWVDQTLNLALGFGGKALKESNYKRLQRFFRGFELDYSEEDGDLLVVIAPPHTVGLVRDYALPWGIET